MARRSPPPANAPKLQLNAAEIEGGIARLTKRREELDQFDPQSLTDWSSPELNALSTAITRALEKTFGENTSDFKRFSSAGNLAYHPMIMVLGGPPIPIGEVRQTVTEHIANARALLSEAIRVLEEDLADMTSKGTGNPAPISPADAAKRRPVFLVHGRDDGTRETVARFLERLGLRPIILHTQPSKGRTIITKFREEAAGVEFAVVLMTPDDKGGISTAGADELRSRARQNVVFELGFFIGALGPARVAALVKGEVEKPSDFEGVVYISLDNGAWKIELARELEAAGYEVDWSAMRE
jgi:predicted nucleotide-binding protein